MQDPTEVFRALADPTRRQILKALKRKDLPAGEITAMFNISFPSISRHLSILKAAGLVSERRQGNSIIYSVNSEHLALCLSEFISAVCPTEIIERHRSRKKP
ncbi:MAG: ArsR family transcriptional regulator [Candidatus Melainabacteria bacterium]|nr:MAG: ArsR family transcriptional regulator [Candidatus Melainabacteria bacterium]